MRATYLATAFALFAGCCFAQAPQEPRTQAGEAPENCFDAEVYATVTQEIPSDVPMIDGEKIVIEWPWFLDLQVERVEYGSVRHGKVSVLTIQHTYLTPHHPGLWWLRRNSIDGFNVVSLGETDLHPCPAGAAPVEPYIGPGKDQTLDDLRRAGERRYGRFPRD